MQAYKETSNKVGGLSDLPTKALLECAKRLTANRDKYPRGNHLKPIKNTDLTDAILRHLFAYLEGEDLDTDTSHLTAIALNALFLEEQRLRGTLIDERLKP